MADADQNSPVTRYTASSASDTSTATKFPDGVPPPQNQPPYVGSVYSDRNIYQYCTNSICAPVILPAIIIIRTIVLIGSLPDLPYSQDPQFRIDTLTLATFNISSKSTSMITSGTIWDARFTVSYPNSKVLIYYDSVDAFISYHSKLISETMVPPFMQGKKNETTVSALFVSQPVYQYVDNRNGINSEKAPGNIHFNLWMTASVRFNPTLWLLDKGRWNSEIDCPNLPVRVSRNSNTGSLVGGSKLCSVRY